MSRDCEGGYEGKNLFTDIGNMVDAVWHRKIIPGLGDECVLIACPEWITRRRDTREVIEAHRWFSSGNFAARHPRPTVALVTAVTCFAAGVDAAEAEKIEKMRQKHGE